MEYRINFTLSVITSIGGLAGSIFTLDLIFSRIDKLNGWSHTEALLVLGFFLFMEGFSSLVLRSNLSRIVGHVRQGTLDFVLLKPVDAQFWLSLRNCSPWGLPNLALGLGVMVWAGRQLGFGASQYLIGIVPLLLGLVVLYSLWFILGTASIWFVKIHSVTYVLHSLLAAGRFPVSAYPAGYQFFFTFVVPAAFLTTVPAEVMLGRQAATGMLLAGAFALGLALIGRLFWRFALRYYTSASS